MTSETMQVLIERARSEAREMDTSAGIRDRWYNDQLQRIQAQAEQDKKNEANAAERALMEEARRDVRAFLHPTT